MSKASFYENLQRDFLQKKLNSPMGLAFVAIIAAALGYIMSKNLLTGAVVLAGILALAVTAYAFVKETFGIALLTALSSVTAFLGRAIVDLPFGTLIEAFIFVLFLGVVIKKSIEKTSFELSNDPIAIALLVYLAYQFLQYFNPALPNRMGALMLIKRNTCAFLFYLICVHAFARRENLFSILKLWFFIAFLLAIYSCKQEWFGFAQFEKNWLYSLGKNVTLIFVDGRYRKFSLLDGPANFGMLMAIVIVFFLVLLSAKLSLLKKTGIFIAIGVMLLGLAFSGTRTAYIMVPMGVSLFCLMNIQKRSTIVLLIFSLIGMGLLLYGPFKDPNIVRIRTAFNPQKDASANVRDINRARIQPYIYDHPIGSGVATIGDNGLRYNPGHELAGFRPDSEYLKTAIEMGIIGYLIMLSVFGFILITIVKRFFLCENANLKTMYAALSCTLFTTIVANYAQEFAFMFPNDLYMPMLFAMGASLYKFDPYYLKKQSPLHEIKTFTLSDYRN